MSGIQLTYNEFVVQVRMSRKPHILLEGSQDLRFFQALYQNLFENQPNVVASEIAIVTAETISSGNLVLGNRGKVELVFQLMSNTTFKNRFVGFVDREFREFSFSGVIIDNLSNQKVIDRLIWSRGHSIENYMFDFDVVKEPLYDFSLSGETAQKALSQLHDNFKSILTTACAMGLAAAKLNYLDAARGTIHWNILRMNGSLLELDTEKWKDALSNHSNLDAQQSLALVSEFEHWFNISKSSGIDEVRWACDGHTGIRLIWAAYAKLIAETRNSEGYGGAVARNQRDTVFGIPETVGFNHFARNWARITRPNAADTPKTCFAMLGFIE